MVRGSHLCSKEAPGSPVHLQPCQGWGRGVPSVSLSAVTKDPTYCNEVCLNEDSVQPNTFFKKRKKEIVLVDHR